MKKIVLITLTISLLSCGIKKDLAASETENIQLELKMQELEKKNQELVKNNEYILKENRTLIRAVDYLKSEDIKLSNEKTKLEALLLLSNL
ncbi:hypothetical protein OAA49_00210 [Flavobacteriales bacterium]|nr:hypothetical protein [Flavobacteriales bacterium]